jgi:hypothetical protein
MYRIQFLEKWANATKIKPPTPVYFEQTFGDNDIPTMSQHWRGMGFLKICSIEIVGDKSKSRYTIEQIIELFYAEKYIRNGKEVAVKLDTEDLQIKKELIEKYSGNKKEAKNIEEAKPVKGLTDEQKAYRKELFVKLEEKKIKYATMWSTEKLENALNN